MFRSTIILFACSLLIVLFRFGGAVESNADLARTVFFGCAIVAAIAIAAHLTRDLSSRPHFRSLLRN